MDYDAVVIGAGLGGCAAGAALASQGKSVLVLEKTGRIGGRCSTEIKNGYPLDIASTTLARCEYGPYAEALRRVGMENEVTFMHMRRSLFKFAGREFRINLNPVLKLMQDMVPPQMLSMAGSMFPAVSAVAGGMIKDLADVTIKDFVCRYTDSVAIKTMIGVSSFFVLGTPYWESSTGELMQLGLDAMGAMLQSAARGETCMGFIKEGLIAYPHALCKGIEEYGGEIRLGVGVKEVLVEGGRVRGVVTGSGEVIEVDVVVSNAGIKETVTQLVGREQFTKEYADYIDSLRPGTAGVCLRLLLDKPVTDADLVFNMPMLDAESYYRRMWEDHEIPGGLPPVGATIPSNMDPEIVPEGHQLILAIAPITFDPKENWPKWEEKILGSVTDILPEVKDHIVWQDFLTPGTYLVFGEEQAPAIGIAQCVGQVRDKRPSSESPLEGLYYVGAEAGTNISGMATEMAIESGYRCADRILERTSVKT